MNPIYSLIELGQSHHFFTLMILLVYGYLVYFIAACDILAQGLIGLIGYSYQQGIPSFPEAHLKRNSG
jgi:hypothetical protein